MIETIKVPSELYSFTYCIVDVEELKKGKRTFPCGDGSDFTLEEEQALGMIERLKTNGDD